MSQDDNNNVVEFKRPQKQTFEQDCYNLDNLTFSMEEFGISFTKEALDKIFEDMVVQDIQADQIAEACFDLQLLVEANPEIAQYVLAHLKKFTQSMQNRLTTK